MSIPEQFPPRAPRAMSVTAALSGGLGEATSAETTEATPAAGSWPWRKAALLASIAGQMITIAALNSADPIPATWAALLLAIAPAPLAVVVLLVGIIGQVTHTGLFFLPALAATAVAALRLWREGA